MSFYRAPPRQAIQGLEGLILKEVGRRGKYLLLKFSNDRILTLHLGMSGRVLIDSDGPHLRFRMDFEGGRLSVHDSRRFGRVGCELPPKMGPEPLEPGFDGAFLKKTLRGRTAPIKAMLLDQRIVAGIGNIYATEALYAAAIRPGRAAGALTLDDCGRLAAVIKSILSRAVELRGSTLDDEAYLDPLGRAGGYQNEVALYGRKTAKCGHPVAATRRVIGGRHALYCAVCQR